jgi:hypothetical protein
MEAGMARTYGRIRLTEDDLKVVRRMLAHGLEVVRANGKAASEEDERAYYSRMLGWYEQQLDRFVKVKPGIAPFTEDDLKLLRGSIFPELKPQLFSRWAQKATLDKKEVEALSAEIDHLHALERKFDQPFLRDTSQDAEPDEEEDEEAEEQHASSSPSK